MISSRENLLSLLRRGGYQYAPVELQLCPSLVAKFKEVAGETPLPEYFNYPEGFSLAGVPGPRVKPRADIDWAKYYDVKLKEGTAFGVYGVANEPGDASSKHMTRMHHPLARMTSLEEIQAFPYPEYEVADITYMVEAAERAHAAGKAAAGFMACTVWETAWYMRDMTMLMMDMSEGDAKATYILDKVTDNSCLRAAAYARAGVDILHLGDDVGMQETIMMSQEMYREWLKPRLAKVIAAAKQAKPDILIHYHTCGFVEPLINDLIEVGVDVLNPVQPECMDFAMIHAKYGDRLSFNGTLGTQTTMPFGTTAEVRRMVFRNLELAGARGGLVCCPTHILEPEVPWENIEAYVKACKEFKTAGG